MVHHKLQEILTCLDRKQHKQLALFLKSPYFNNSYNAEAILKLYLHLKTARGAKSGKKEVSDLFFPNKPFHEHKKNQIDSLSSDLFRLVKQFLNIESEENQPGSLKEQQILANFYQLHGLEERFWQTIASWKKQIKKLKIQDAQFFQNSFLLEQEIASFQSTFNTYSDDANLINANKLLDQYYLVQKLEIYSILEYQVIIGSRPRAELNQIIGKELLSSLSDLPYTNLTYVRLYLIILEMLGENISESRLLSLELILEKEKNKILPQHFRNFQAFYRYFYGGLYFHKQDKEGLERLFNLYNKHLTEGYFYINDGEILQSSFKLIINIGLKLGKFDWVMSFLENHPPERITGTRFPQETFQLSLADLYFYQKKYDEAAEALEYRLFENIKFSLLADLLLIKIYYETSNDLLESRINALIQKNRRAKMADSDKTGLNNFLRILERLLKLKYAPENQNGLSTLKNRIQSEKLLVERAWILEKTREEMQPSSYSQSR